MSHDRPTGATNLADSLSIREASLLSHRSEKTLRRAYASGELRARRDGPFSNSQLRFRREDVVAWVAANTATADDQLDRYIAHVVAAAPELTPAQRDRLAAALVSA